MFSTTTELLEHGKRVLTDPSKWTQGVGARLKNGSPCSPTTVGAEQFCSVGVLIQEFRFGRTDHSTLGSALKLLDEASEIKGNTAGSRPCAYYNDTRTHSEVMEMWTRAINLSKTA